MEEVCATAPAGVRPRRPCTAAVSAPTVRPLGLPGAQAARTLDFTLMLVWRQTARGDAAPRRRGRGVEGVAEVLMRQVNYIYHVPFSQKK